MQSFEIRSVSLADKELFDSYFSDFEPINSEYTFTNMFIWRKSYNIRYSIIDGMLCIFSRHGDSGSETVNFPLGNGDIKAVLQKILNYFSGLEQRPLIRLYSQESIEALNSAYPGAFIITEDIDSFDYVYNTSDLIELSGNKYHSKRNHINNFKKLYRFEYRQISAGMESRCFEMFGHWCDSKAGLVPGISEQREAVKELLNNRAALGVTGGALMVNEEIAAFSFGEVLSRKHSIAVIHLEHADTNFQGSFPMINQQFLKHEWSTLKYVNREEDMGLPGLRKAKESYKPCFMVTKYIASLS